MSAVDDFLQAIRDAGIDECEAWAHDCALDATVPNWRFRKRGPAAIKAVYRQWFAYPNRLLELRRWSIPNGEIVEYTHEFAAPDGVRSAHHLHVLELRDAEIATDTMFCGGQATAAQLAKMAAAGG